MNWKVFEAFSKTCINESDFLCVVNKFKHKCHCVVLPLYSRQVKVVKVGTMSC